MKSTRRLCCWIPRSSNMGRFISRWPQRSRRVVDKKWNKILNLHETGIWLSTRKNKWAWVQWCSEAFTQLTNRFNWLWFLSNHLTSTACFKGYSNAASLNFPNTFPGSFMGGDGKVPTVTEVVLRFSHISRFSHQKPRFKWSKYLFTINLISETIVSRHVEMCDGLLPLCKQFIEMNSVEMDISIVAFSWKRPGVNETQQGQIYPLGGLSAKMSIMTNTIWF